jgi:hypothetical protein
MFRSRLKCIVIGPRRTPFRDLSEVEAGIPPLLYANFAVPEKRPSVANVVLTGPVAVTEGGEKWHELQMNCNRKGAVR